MEDIHTDKKCWYQNQQALIAAIATIAILSSIILRLIQSTQQFQSIPLYIAYVLGGIPLIFELLKKVFKGEFGSDLLAGISIITSLLLNEYLAGVFVILMLSGGEALEEYALKRASSVLDALSKRMPRLAFRKTQNNVEQIDLDAIKLGDLLEVRPHDICPVDGEVTEGRGSMDESFLTGEPYRVQKLPGTFVISGAINGESLLVIKTTALPIDSRYQKIAKVIESQASKQVPMRRLGDKLGAWYTPLALLIAALAWIFSNDPTRFLSVLVVATPCPLLIAIPIAIIGAISSAASKGIIIKNPAALEFLSTCKTMILDKTGTLTYGKPTVTNITLLSKAATESELLAKVAALEVYSKHPLAEAIVEEAKKRKLTLPTVTSVSEKPGQGLTGVFGEHSIHITSRKKVESTVTLPPRNDGLECIIVEDTTPIGIISFRDTPRKESKAFVEHVDFFHGIKSVKILSGDRTKEVEHLAKLVGIKDVLGDLSPEDKLLLIQKEVQISPTVYIGDGINDAPALQAATVGIAIGQNSDITSEAADAVILEPSLIRVDELLHIAKRMRKIGFESALGGMGLSIIGMILASFGLISPLAGAITQEVIDIMAVLNSLRTSFPEKESYDKVLDEKV